MAVELVLNPWSMLVEIDTIGSELAGIDPMRLHHHEPGDSSFLDHFADKLEAEPYTDDPDQFHALLAVAENSGGDVSKVVSGVGCGALVADQQHSSGRVRSANSVGPSASGWPPALAETVVGSARVV